MGEFGLLWREHYRDNSEIDYRFQQRGSGIRGSIAEDEIKWFMNQDFRLALTRDWKKDEAWKVIDFTRYDLPAQEPGDPQDGELSRNWSLMNVLNQKGTRPQDKPTALSDMKAEDQALIRKHYSELFPASSR